jgi:putative GTP pyrophosphokinase
VPRPLSEEWPASKRKIDAAAEMVREWWFDLSQPADRINTDLELRAAAELVWLFRLGFQRPLNKVTMGVRSMVRSEGSPIIVSQRLKRLPTIMGKLARYPEMNLSRMQDIGGCRAILPARADVEGVITRVGRSHWDVRRLDDYHETPKPTGYRAVHIVVLRAGRLIEIQLRTPGQQGWAAMVDRTSGHLGVPLKDGDGPEELLRFFEHASRGIALEEAGVSVDQQFRDEFRALQEEVRHYFPNGT